MAKKKKKINTKPKSEKDLATERGEPWVSVVNIEIDEKNLSEGAVELDWNDLFIARLMKAGYQGTDVQMVDQWFQNVCRNVIENNYEQHIAQL